MVDPEFFDVTYVINPHMSGQQGKVDRRKARQQWEALKAAYESIGCPVIVLPAQPKLVDMVFAANQSFPFVDAQRNKKVILSRMATQERAPEVAHFADWYRHQGYTLLTLKSDGAFEGMGDLLWHPDKNILWGGFGFRTDPKVYEEIAALVETPVQLLELIDPEFYHLDTCFSPITSEIALYYPPAFTVEGQKLLKTFFKDLIEVPKQEALVGFACNGDSPDGKHYLLQKGSPVTMRELSARGFQPVELETSEFLKSGGSVFCLKMKIPL